MSVLDKLACALDRRDEVPNQELAQEIVRTKNRAAVKELVANLSNKNKAIPSDCIKVLYEVGMQAPKLIATYYAEFGDLLESKHNRLVWGAMIALDTIAGEEPVGVFELLPKILACSDAGTVITRDHAVGVLIKLSGEPKYAKKCLPLLIEQMKSCPDNQFPMYVERAAGLFDERNKKPFVDVMMRRLDHLPKESQKKRVMKVLKRLA